MHCSAPTCMSAAAAAVPLVPLYCFLALGSVILTSAHRAFPAFAPLPSIVQVVGEPHIRFYAGAPLISSANGYRYGTVRACLAAATGAIMPPSFKLLPCSRQAA